MEDPKDLAEKDQQLAAAADTLPPVWFRLYSNMIEVGFTRQEAFELLKCFITQRAAP